MFVNKIVIEPNRVPCFAYETSVLSPYLTGMRQLETSKLSPYLTGMRQPETSSRIVRDYYATKINDINKTFMLQSH